MAMNNILTKDGINVNLILHRGTPLYNNYIQ